MKRVAHAIALGTCLVWVGCTHHKGAPTPAEPASPTAANRESENANSDRNDTRAVLLAKEQSCFRDGKLYCLGMMLFAAKQQGHVPTNVDQTLPYLREAGNPPSGTNRFDILYHGSMDELPRSMTNGILLLRSESWRGADGTWKRAYGFADGHCEVHSEPDNHFDAWEKQHLAKP